MDVNKVNNDYNEVEDLAEMIASEIESHIIQHFGSTMHDYYSIMNGVYKYAEEVALKTQDMLRDVKLDVLGSYTIHDNMYKDAEARFRKNELDREYEIESCEDKPIRRAPTFY